MKEQISFESWLENWYEENVNNNSNNMNPEFEDARDAWFSNLDVQEVIDFGDEYGKEQHQLGRVAFADELSPQWEKLKKLFNELLASIPK
jgi:hypothetical protein